VQPIPGYQDLTSVNKETLENTAKAVKMYNREKLAK